ncbi:MAG: 3-deoxy-D-manno-octulosonic acid transferase [Planctomycetaceae bacterium]
MTQGKYPWSEKFFGRLPPQTDEKPAVWFHAVSVGEVLQLQQVVSRFRQEQPGYRIVISCTTVTGRAVALEKFPDDQVCYFPLDFSWAVRNAIQRINPQLMVLVELELWPNFILEIERQQIPLALINGRISEKSYRGYRRLRPLMQRLLCVFDALAVQSPLYGERLQNLGATSSQIEVTGSIKFDGVVTDRQNSKSAEIRNGFGLKPDEYVFIAGSTQSPEEKYALETYQALNNRFPNLRLIIVPRHKERFEEVAQLIENEGFSVLRRSQIKQGGSNSAPAAKAKPVLLLDTLGELNACWGLADFAFVGGSLTNRGGQNMIEPAAYAAVVTFGPNTRNFKDVVDLLLANEAAEVIADQQELTSHLEYYLSHPDAGRERGEVARQLVLSQQGATQRTVEMLGKLIPNHKVPATEAA